MEALLQSALTAAVAQPTALNAGDDAVLGRLRQRLHEVGITVEPPVELGPGTLTGWGPGFTVPPFVVLIEQRGPTQDQGWGQPPLVVAGGRREENFRGANGEWGEDPVVWALETLLTFERERVPR